MRPTLICLSLVLLAALAGAALELPYTPTITVNRKVTLAQVGEKGRIYIAYNVAPVGGQGLLFSIYKPGQKADEKPFKEWVFQGASGNPRISFNDLPIAVYRAYGTAIDAAGNPVAQRTPLPVHVEYGGWRAWEAYERSFNTDLRGTPPPFMGLSGAGDGKVTGIQLDPPTLVLNPSEAAEIKAELVGLPAEEELQWDLNGEGDLEILSPTKVLYIAPEESGPNRISRIDVKGRLRPDIQATVVILLTDLKKDEFQK